MGRAADGLPGGLDDHRWPAARNPDGPSPQYGWEPLRVIRPRSLSGRVQRVSALGDAVVPQQAALAITVLWQRMEAGA